MGDELWVGSEILCGAAQKVADVGEGGVPLCMESWIHNVWMVGEILFQRRPYAPFQGEGSKTFSSVCLRFSLPSQSPPVLWPSYQHILHWKYVPNHSRAQHCLPLFSLLSIYGRFRFSFLASSRSGSHHPASNGKIILSCFARKCSRDQLDSVLHLRLRQQPPETIKKVENHKVTQQEMQPGTQMSPFHLPEIHCPTSLKMFSVYLCKCVWVYR